MTINGELGADKEFCERQPFFIKHFNVLKFHRLLASQKGVWWGELAMHTLRHMAKNYFARLLL